MWGVLGEVSPLEGEGDTEREREWTGGSQIGHETSSSSLIPPPPLLKEIISISISKQAEWKVWPQARTHVASPCLMCTVLHALLKQSTIVADDDDDGLDISLYHQFKYCMWRKEKGKEE